MLTRWFRAAIATRQPYMALTNDEVLSIELLESVYLK